MRIKRLFIAVRSVKFHTVDHSDETSLVSARFRDKSAERHQPLEAKGRSGKVIIFNPFAIGIIIKKHAMLVSWLTFPREII